MNGPLYVGIDAGSSATKCVVLTEPACPRSGSADAAASPRLAAHSVVPSGFDYGEAAERALSIALESLNVREVRGSGGQGVRGSEGQSVGGSGDAPVDPRTPGPQDPRTPEPPHCRCVATGYGRERVPFADRGVTEITCHARGAREWYPDVRSIIDIGGQDTKVIWLNAHGRMADYRMNAKCAAGTGTFLESIALKLGVPLSEIDALAMQSAAETVVNSYCTVFAGTEVIERVKSGEPREDISMGLFRSIASRVFEMLALRDGPIAATGGVVAHCRAMVRALEEVLETKILLPPLPQHAGAYGAALLAWEAAQEAVSHQPSAFSRRRPMSAG